MPRNDTELLYCLDDEGNEIAALPRDIVHQKPLNLWHATTAVWVLNNDNEFLCSKRADFVETNPGKWQAYAGGHVLAGSSVEKSAKAELYEELGLELDLTLIDIIWYKDKMHVSSIFTGRWNGNISELLYNDGEIAEVRWITFDEYEKEYERHPDKWKGLADKDIYKMCCQK